MSCRLLTLLALLTPQKPLTIALGWVARWRAGKLSTALIRWFVQRYQVDMTQAQHPDLSHYACFNDFFTRALRPEARPLAPTGLLCPVDGTVSQCGRIEGRTILQAKGHLYDSKALLAGDRALATQFENGFFATLYLSPRDYHRIHMPCDGRLTRMIHVPGRLYSVNPATAECIPSLFAHNERVVCVFEGERGTFAMVLVGATIVGSIATVWHGVVNPIRPGTVRQWHYPKPTVTLRRGEEMGRFLLGSTVIVLFPAVPLQFPGAWQPGRPVRMGEVLATVGNQ
ncbi:archaetidylserine decarboxylase [Candidatus Symbiobacter mobilis]|uniref:Phosphatidylserine decarboxylase proenzyme n=1 Tax=Candidatus Symbiobacter mobilis CR TaxID=946483 RepID=U5N4L4_9BURK|nr:archaetidylserine decarboxylase [Candidatus Symbiobacter mobilis]AGX86277.1 phosphatidylserine decarboxylase [Candidatus Symbiobacter mobilis CR]